MAITPVALGVQIPQPYNPVEGYGNVLKLQAMQQQNALASAQMAELERERNRNALVNQAWGSAVNPQTGAIDYNKLVSAFAQGGQGSLIPGIKKSQSEAEKADFEARSAKQKYAIEFLNAARDQLTPGKSLDEVLAISAATHKHPVVGPLLADMGIDPAKTQQDTIAAFNAGRGDAHIINMAAGADKLIQGIKLVDTMDKGVPVTRGVTASGQTLWQMAAQPKQPAAQVNLFPGPKAEQSKKGELNVEIYKEVRDDAKRSRKMLPAIDTAINILEKGFDTGFGTEAKFQAARVLSALGIPEADKYASNAAVFQSTVAQTVLDRQLEQKGPQTEADAARITQTSAELKNPKDANRFILNVAKAQANRAISQQRFYDQWWNKNGTYEGAEEAWYSGEGGKSLFEDPLLSKKNFGNSASTTSVAAGANTITTPDGKTLTFPSAKAAAEFKKAAGLQ